MRNSTIYNYNYNETSQQPANVGLNKNAPSFKYSTPQKNDWDFSAEKSLYPNYSGYQKSEGHSFVAKKGRHKKKKLTYEEEVNSFFVQQ
jgi:hypothetical protein